MKEFAERKANGTTYAGVIFEGDKLEFDASSLPRGGLDIADEMAAWIEQTLGL